jgi:hypothetical protein
LVIDVDSFVGEVCGRLKQGAAYGYTHLLGYHPILATRADTRETGSRHHPREIQRLVFVAIRAKLGVAMRDDALLEGHDPTEASPVRRCP